MSTTTRPRRLARALTVLAVGAALVAAPVGAAVGATPDAAPTSTATSTATDEPTPSSTTTPTTPDPEPSSTPDVTPAGEETPPDPSPTTTATAPTSSAASDVAKAPLAAAPLADPAAEAAGFVSRTLADFGDVYVYPDFTTGELDPSGYPDVGNTIDAVLALAASGSGGSQMAASLDKIEALAGDYTGTAWGETYVGSTAKLVLVLAATGRNPRDVGGADLVAQLTALETAGGRFSDAASGDYTITITQALGVLALVRAGEPVSTSSVQYLLDQQCPDGGFRSELGGAGCTSDPDATAFAAQALIAVSGGLLCWGDAEVTGRDADAGARAALSYLAGLQTADGGLPSTDGIVNANTTAVAGQAFAAGGMTLQAQGTRDYLANVLQYDLTAPPALQGGVAFSTETRSASEPADSDIRATPQSALDLLGGSLVSVAAPDVPFAAPPELCPAEPVRPGPSPTTSGSSTSAPSTSTPTRSTSTAAAPAATTTTPGGDPVAAGSGPGSLAQTGSNLLLPALVGVALVLLGALALWGSRRRGAHT